MSSVNPVNQILLISSTLIAAFLVFSLVKKEKSEGLRLLLFWGMVIPIVSTTLYLAGTTIAKNQFSATGGPVHWHADYEIYACGRQIDLVDPSGLANRVGTPDLHEHGDNRIHVEGTVRELQDVSLGKFFESVGGQLTETLLRVPTNEGELIAQNGMQCPDDKPGALQVFVYQTKAHTVIQKKLSNFPNYVLSPHSQVPPGDCLIIEFTAEIKDKTDKICEFYEIAIQKGELKLK